LGIDTRARAFVQHLQQTVSGGQRLVCHKHSVESHKANQGSTGSK